MCALLLQDLPKPPDWSAAYWLLAVVLLGIGAFIARVGVRINDSVLETKVAMVAHTKATEEMSATIKASTLVMGNLATQMQLLVQQLASQGSAIAALSAKVDALGAKHDGGSNA